MTKSNMTADLKGTSEIVNRGVRQIRRDVWEKGGGMERTPCWHPGPACPHEVKQWRVGTNGCTWRRHRASDTQMRSALRQHEAGTAPL